jgi:hypothetical protein
VASLLRRCLNREPNHRPSAASAARVLARSGGPGTVADPVGETTFWGELRRRRFPQFVGSAMLVGGTVIAFASEVLVGQFGAYEVLRPLSVPLAICGVAAAIVITWFHGERGAQESGALEWVFHGVIGVIWLTSSAWILFF